MTVHRDALAAAQAKIAALESALEDARVGVPTDDALRSEIARLEMLLSAAHAERHVAEERAEKAEVELGRIRAEQARAERLTKKTERDAARGARGAAREAHDAAWQTPEPPRRNLRSMVTLDQHNRSFPAQTPTQRWRPAGVLCQACAENGELVELGDGVVEQDHGSMALQHVVCPRCGFMGAKRAR